MSEEFCTQLVTEEKPMEPLSKEITQEIRTILEECRDGKRLHRQAAYATETSCGTAHCIAGWKVHDDFGNNVEYVPWSSFDNAMDIRPKKEESFDAWEYARDAWKLTESESDTLFDMDATFEEQFSLLEKLEAGNRFI
jgi:hypothetical protein